MKIGVAINLFNGEELLEQCLLNIRNIADIIVVVYSNISNFNTDAKDLKPLIDGLIKKKLIDKAIIYVPISQKSNNIGADNELEKRNISLEYLKENDCNYLIDLDCDEFYLSDKLKDAIKYIDYFGYDSAFCKMKTYYRYADCEIIPAENYYVPCLYKINKNSKFDRIFLQADLINSNCDCKKVDTTAKVDSNTMVLQKQDNYSDFSGKEFMEKFKTINTNMVILGAFVLLGVAYIVKSNK